MKHNAQRDFRTVLAGIDGYWSVCTGGRAQGDVNVFDDAGNEELHATRGGKRYSDLTIRREYDPARDQPIVARLSALCPGWESSVTRTPTTPEGLRRADPTEWGVVLKNVNDPEQDRRSGEPAQVELVFAVTRRNG